MDLPPILVNSGASQPMMCSAPVHGLDGALPGSGLLAEILRRKSNEHNPLERQSRIFIRKYGVQHSPSTLGDLYSRSMDLLEPIHQRVGKVCQSRSHLSTDATPLPVLDRDDPRGIKRGRLWPVRSDCEVLFLYAPTGTGTLVSEFLADFKGTLQTDGASTVNKLFDGYCRNSGKQPGRSSSRRGEDRSAGGRFGGQLGYAHVGA